MGARILQLGGVKRVFKRIFGIGEGEKLLKASQCYLSTTAGPIAGLLFISTQRVAFCSERSIKISSPNSELVRIHYKVAYSHNSLDLSKCIISLSIVANMYVKFLFCAGLHPTKKHKESQPKCKCENAITEIHGNSYYRQLRVLVYGVLELSESFPLSSTGTLSISNMTYKSTWKCFKQDFFFFFLICLIRCICK